MYSIKDQKHIRKRKIKTKKLGKKKQKKHSQRLLSGPPKIRKNKKTKKPWENQNKKKNILRDSCLDPPKSEKMGKPKKTRKHNSQTLLSQPSFPQDFPRIVFFCFPKLFLLFLFLILGGPDKSL